MSPSLRLPRLRSTAEPPGIQAASDSQTEAREAGDGIAADRSPGLESTVDPAPAPPAFDSQPTPAAVAVPEPSTFGGEAPTTQAAGAAGPLSELARPTVAGAPNPEPDMRRATVADGIAFLAAYRRAVLSWVAADGYPMNVDIEIEVKAAEGTVRFAEPAGFRIEGGTPVALTGSYVRTRPEGGFDERSHVTVWGVASARPRGRFAVSPVRVWVLGERDQPFALSYDRRVPQARRYYEADSLARGVYTRPRLSTRLALYRAAHAPYLVTTVVPLLLGLAAAVRAGVFDLVAALVIIAVGAVVHLGINIANGLFDLLYTPAQGGPGRVASGDKPGLIQEAAGRIRTTPPEAIACYGVAAALGVLLFALRGSSELMVLAVVGLVLGGAYRAPPLRLAGRGLGELAAAVGFGPVLLLGTYSAQTRGPISLEATVLSAAVGLLAGLVVLVDEIPNRAEDARVGRLTLPARWSKAAVLRTYDLACAGSFFVVAAGVIAGVLPIPCLLALVAVPMATRVRAGLVRNYRRHNELATVVSANARLHMNVGLLLAGGYVLTIADQAFLGRTPFLW